MGKYKIVFDEPAQRQLSSHYKGGDKSTLKKIAKILGELEIHPKTGSGNPEALKHQLSGFWSRKINSKDRLIYRIEEAIITVYIISAMGHYGDK